MMVCVGSDISCHPAVYLLYFEDGVHRAIDEAWHVDSWLICVVDLALLTNWSFCLCG